MWGFPGSGCRLPIIAAMSIAAAALGSPSSAGSFKVNPVQIKLPADQQAASLTITNSDAAPVAIRVLTFAWSQANGEDRYTPTANVIVSPPIFTIPAGGTQLVRVGLRERGAERAYRVILEEIPRQKPLGGEVQVILRLNLPLYLIPKGGSKPDVSWRAWRAADGTIDIEGRNRGTLYEQVAELAVEGDGRAEVLSRQMGVVLPGSSRIWKVRGSKQLQPGGYFTLKVRSSAGEIEAPVLLESR
jgi:fimbrial chaperone protein